MAGMDDVLKNLDALKKKAEEASREVQIADLLTDDFLRRNTDFQTLEEMLDAGGFHRGVKVPSEEWNAFVALHTPLGGWDELVQAAHLEWMKAKMGF